MSHFLHFFPKYARENKMNRSSSSFEDSVRVTENFLRPPKSDCDAEDAVVALDEIDAFLTEYVRLFDQGLLEKKNESESLIDGEEFVSGTYFWPKKTKTKEEDEEDNKGEEEEKKEKTKKKRTIIEKYCEQLAEYVAEEQKLLPWESFAGCEWWVQDVAHDEPPKAYHTDCVLEEDKDKRKKKYYPLLSTVYYGKTERGGATVAFDEEEYDAMRKCVLVKPRANRLFTFRGDMWHGVCREENSERKEGEEDAYQRVTLLVNFWKERPSCARDFPRELFSDDSSSFSRSSGFSGRRGDDDDEKVPEREVISLKTADDDERVFKLKSDERKAHFAAWEAQNPSAFLEPSTSSSSVVLIEYTS